VMHTRLRKKWLGLLWLLLAVVLLPALWFGLDFIYVSSDNVTDYAVPSDVIIVLGCPSYENNVISVLFTQTKSNTPGF
jgi:hypothetical protein